MKQEISSVYDALGIDADELEWQDLAICHGQPIGLFHEQYESDPSTAKIVDQMCFSCPVRAMCLQAGVENGEHGVWGAVFLVAGKADEAKNGHKTAEDWKRVKEAI